MICKEGTFFLFITTTRRAYRLQENYTQSKSTLFQVPESKDDTIFIFVKKKTSDNIHTVGICAYIKSGANNKSRKLYEKPLVATIAHIEGLK